MEHDLSGAQRLIRSLIDTGEIDGAGVAVATGTEPVAEWYTGYASGKVPAGPETLWPLASISKLYTAAAVMSVVEDGLLTLSMRLADVLPEFDSDQLADTRLWHLLTHTSGMIYESPEMEYLLANRVPLPQIIDEAFTFTVTGKPGTRFEYSDYGIALAARAAEVVTGQSFPDLVQERVISPASLHDTHFPPNPSVYDRIATIRDVPATGTAGEMYNSDYCRSLEHPSFGVYASVQDLLQFGLLFHPVRRRSILSRATVASMTRDQLGGGRTGGLVDVELTDPQPWGLGFMVRGSTLQLGFGELATEQAFGHPGASGCVLLVDPLLDVSIAFASNRHAVSGFDRFLYREAAVTNALLAAMTR